MQVSSKGKLTHNEIGQKMHCNKFIGVSRGIQEAMTPQKFLAYQLI